MPCKCSYTLCTLTCCPLTDNLSTLLVFSFFSDLFSAFGRFNPNDVDDVCEMQTAELKQWAVEFDVLSKELDTNMLLSFFQVANKEVDIEGSVAEDDSEASQSDDADSGGEDNDADNDDFSLLRFEFVIVCIMCAHFRYFKSSNDDLCAAVQEFASRHIHRRLRDRYSSLPRMDKKWPVLHHPNDFRHTILYSWHVNAVLSAHLKFLQSVFVHFSKSNGNRNELRIDYFFKFAKAVRILDSDMSERDLLLCFSWSRMRVRDELKERARVAILTMADFMEALVRIAVAKDMSAYARFLSGQPKAAQDQIPMKWAEIEFNPTGPALEMLAGQHGSDVDTWTPEYAAHALEIFIQAIRHCLSYDKVHLPKLNPTKVRVLLSKNISSHRASKVPKSHKQTSQNFDANTGLALLTTSETGFVRGITVSANAEAALMKAFTKVPKSARSRRKSRMLSLARKMKTGVSS